jgi:Amidohydrolase
MRPTAFKRSEGLVMTKWDGVWRCAAVLGALLVPAGASAQQQQLKIFDAHLHYNQEPDPFFSLDKVLEVFKRNGVAGIIANSRPNKGTHQLVDAKAPGLWVVPFIRPYRIRADVQGWSTEPAIYELIQSEFKRGYYRGVGEFHIYGQGADVPLVKKAVDFAAERDLYILAHCDETALLILFRHNPKAKIIWAHTGFTTPPERVRELLDKYPALWGELSYRSGITEGSGALSAEWKKLFASHSDRFVLGSDTWINERWFSYDTIMKNYRAWLAQLPTEQARRIAHGNAERLFGGKVE